MLDLDSIFDSDRRHAEAMRRAGMYSGAASATLPAPEPRAAEPPHEPVGDDDAPVALQLSATDRAAIAFNQSEPTPDTSRAVESRQGLHTEFNAPEAAATWPTIPAGTPRPVADLCEAREGWTPGGWQNRLRQLTRASKDTNPDTAAELRRAADLFKPNQGSLRRC